VPAVKFELAIVIVVHNARDRVTALLDGLARDPARTRWEVVVIDNASVDGSGPAIAAQHPWVRVVRNDRGRGFAGGINQGVSLTTAPAVLALDPDAVVPPGALSRLLSTLEADASVAAVGPLIRNLDGTVQRHGLFRPRPYTALIVLLGLGRLPFLRREVERYYGVHARGPATPVELLTGACLMFRRAAFAAVGPFDERFFVYCEDVDWCIRAGEAGWRLLFVPEVDVAHEKSVWSRSSSRWAIRTYYRSVRSFYAKHHAPRSPALVRGLWYAGAYLKEGAALLADAARVRKGLRY
jgi:GT2 family glycosyltransferase